MGKTYDQFGKVIDAPTTAELTAGVSVIVLKAPNNSLWKLTVSNAGALTAVTYP